MAGLAESSTDLSGLQTAVNVASRATAHLHAAFVVLAAYVALTVWNTKDEQILGSARMHLPVVGIDVPISGFFFVAPLLLLIAHFSLLVQTDLLLSKILPLRREVRRLRSRPHQAQIERLKSDSFVLVQLAFGDDHPKVVRAAHTLVVFLSIVAMPLLVLLYVQERFLPSHNPTVLLAQRIVVCGEVLLLWFFAVVARWRFAEEQHRAPDADTSCSWSSAAGLGALAVGATALSVWIAGFSLFVLAVPGSYSDVVAWYRIPAVPELLRRLVRSNLELSEKVLVDSAPAPELVAAYYQRGQPTETAWRENAKGLDLYQRDLRCADLKRATLTNADLRLAHLEGANLGGAHLEGARITLKGQEEGGFETAGANLNYAELWGLTLPEVDLQSADMRASYLHGTDFRGGDLRKAQLFGAWIRVMNLEGADLREAELVAVDGDWTDLRGADLRGARLLAADLTFADLRGADLRGAQLEGTSLCGARLDGADLREANLWNARLDNATLEFADLRGVKFEAPTESERQKLASELDALKEGLSCPNNRFRLEAGGIAARLAHLGSSTAGLHSQEGIENQNAMYEPSAPFHGWPQPQPEGRYLSMLTNRLADQACNDAYLTRGLLLERSEYPERNRPEFAPRGSWQAPFEPLDGRIKALFSELSARQCKSLKELPEASLALLRVALNRSRPVQPFGKSCGGWQEQ